MFRLRPGAPPEPRKCECNQRIYIEQTDTANESGACARPDATTRSWRNCANKATLAQDRGNGLSQRNTDIDDLTQGTAVTKIQALDNMRQHLIETQNLRRSFEAKEVRIESSATRRQSPAPSKSLKEQLENAARASRSPQEHLRTKPPKIQELETQISPLRGSRWVRRNDLFPPRGAGAKYAWPCRSRSGRTGVCAKAQTRAASSCGARIRQSYTKHALEGFDQLLFQAVAKLRQSESGEPRPSRHSGRANPTR